MYTYTPNTAMKARTQAVARNTPSPMDWLGGTPQNSTLRNS